MPGATKGGGDFFKPAPGMYIGEFRGYERTDRTFPTRRTKKDEFGNEVEEMVDEYKLRWSFGLSDTQGNPIIDPKKNVQAVAQQLTSLTMGSGQGNEATARKYMRAILASKGQLFDDSVEPDELEQRGIGARVLMTYGARGNNPSSLLDVSPMMPQPTPASAAAPVAVAPGATAEIPPVGQ